MHTHLGRCGSTAMALRWAGVQLTHKQLELLWAQQHLTAEVDVDTATKIAWVLFSLPPQLAGLLSARPDEPLFLGSIGDVYYQAISAAQRNVLIC